MEEMEMPDILAALKEALESKLISVLGFMGLV
jgi:hypothetical protein